jgi:cystathionine beta-lyase
MGEKEPLIMNFDQIFDRNEYPAFKWNKQMLAEHFGNAEALPFWVADMDFQAPDMVTNSLLQRAKHGIFGYEYRTDSYFVALTNWYKNRYDWQIDLKHLEQSPGVLNIISIIINQHSEVGDGIIVQPPVFFEFRSLIRSNHRKMIKNPLNLVDGRYEMDFDDLEKKAANPDTKIMIICNPHNPVGRVWGRDELARAGEICRKHNVLVISDEIHGDIVYSPHRYTPFASLSDELAQISVTCISPAKTFNVAGMVDALAVIANEQYREQFHDFAHRYQINKTNVFASAAVEAAYSHGDAWLDELLAYLRGNIDFIQAFLADNLPQVTLVKPEGTYLVWLNFQALGLEAKALEKFLAENAGIAVNPGYWFGREGAGYARMNIACPRPVIQEALQRLTNAVHNHL